MGGSNEIQGTKARLKRTLEDPIIKILLRNSNLTKIQFETFLIDLVSDELLNKRAIGEEKAHLRIEKGNISRGSFNRSLGQAKINIIRSIYTVLLLGYSGVFDSPRLEPYIEVASYIRGYLDDRRGMEEYEEDSEATKFVVEELREVIEKLAKRTSLSRKM